MTENLKNNKVIAIVGPTASGKTAYSIELAHKLNGEIISADSRLVYKGFDIGTAKPTKEEQQGIPHYMIDIVEPEFDYSAGLYVKDAKQKILEILSRNIERIPALDPAHISVKSWSPTNIVLLLSVPISSIALS